MKTPVKRNFPLTKIRFLEPGPVVLVSSAHTCEGHKRES